MSSENSDEIVVSVDSELEDLIPKFMELAHRDVDEIDEALKAQNFKRIADIGHSLKGVGGAYGFDRVSEIGGNIERSGKAADAGKIGPLNAELRVYLQKVRVVFA